MQPLARKTSVQPKTKKKVEDESGSTRKLPEEKSKKSSYDVSTPRTFSQKSTAADIYAQKKNLLKTPKKVVGTSSKSNVSPMKDLLKSSPSSVSQISTKSTLGASSKKTQKKIEKPLHSARSTVSTKSGNLPFSNVTVNSPIVKRRLNLNLEQNQKSDTKETREKSLKASKEVEKSKSFAKGDSKEINPVSRQRTKTRTLEEDEVKLLKPDVDNNMEMQKLSSKLSAKPTAFYVELSGDKPEEKKDSKSSDEDVSYEDDFESYESDFDSYHSERSDASEQQSEQIGQQSDDGREPIQDGRLQSGNESKEIKDEEKMLDSGSFDLRDRWSASRRSELQFIVEGQEDEHKPSLSDEGFQDMSSGASLKHVDVLDRPLFIDFTKSKETKRKKKLNDKLKQRANDLLNMITLHEMSYSLFEMKPIPYDLYMATFGRSNYTQIACQTFEDGITEEIQTDEVLCENRWTQHPVEFSKNDICINTDMDRRKSSRSDEDYLSKFTFLTQEINVDVENKMNTDKDYKENPLRILFEQKDGAGDCKMLPYENYKSKLEKKDFNVNRLGRFLKKVEGKVCNILNVNVGAEIINEQIKSSKLPFSRGYLTINFKNPQLTSLRLQKVTKLLFSDTKSNLIMTIHSKSSVATDKCVICLWDISVARREPLKLLVAIDNVAIARYSGAADGIFVAALEDGSIHLWDLSEEQSNSIAREEKPADWVENTSQETTDKESIFNSSSKQFPLQSCGFTSSAANMAAGESTERVVGLDIRQHSRAINQDGGRKIIGQICSLQLTGILEIWAIVQEKTRSIQDTGKAFWSKMKLELTQKIYLNNYIDILSIDLNKNEKVNFNLNAAKRRLTNRKLEKKSRVKSASSSNFESDSSSSVANATKMLPDMEKVAQTWENGVVCYDLKVAQFNKIDNYLVAKNCGEVLCFTRNTGAVKIFRFCVATDSSSITCIAVSPHEFPYFLAATDTGTVHLCSVDHARVLLTLDCRNTPPVSQDVSDVCQSDQQGRYVSSVTVKTHASLADHRNKLPITSLHWSSSNPCCVYTVASGAVVVWDLTHSDITARCVSVNAAADSALSADVLAILTPEGEVQVHRLASGSNDHYVQLFHKYVSLL